MGKRVTIAATVCSAALVAATFTSAVAINHHDSKPAVTATSALEQESVSIPSDSEVSAAKADPETRVVLMKRIKAELEKTGRNYDKIAEQAQSSWDALSEAQQTAVTRSEQAEEAARQAKAADAKVASSQQKVGQIASEIYKNGGNEQAKNVLSGDPQANLDRAETAHKLADSRTRDLKSSERDANLAGQWKAYKDAAQKQSEEALGAQTEAEKTAREQAKEYRDAVNQYDSDQAQLFKRAAELNGTTIKQEQAAYEKRVEAKRQKDLEKAKQAEADKQREAENQKKFEKKQQSELQAGAVKGVSKPRNVIQPMSSSDGAQEEGASSDAEKAKQAEADKKAAAEKAEQAKKDAAAKEAKEAKEAAEKKEAEEKAEKEAADKQQAEKKSKKAEQKQPEPQAQIGPQDENSQESSSSTAQKTKQAKQHAAKAKAERERVAADKAAQQRRDVAAQKQAQERQAAAKRAAAKKAEQKKAAEQREAQQRAAAKQAAAKKAAQKRAAEKRAAEQRAAQQRAAQQRAAQQAAAKKAAEKKAAERRATERRAAEKKKREQAAANNAGSSSKEAAIAWAVSIANNDYYGYVFGGNGPRYFDCSSFSMTAFHKSGVNMPRTSSAQYFNAPTKIPLSQLKRGDLVFSSSNGGASMYHVAIYMGNGQVVQARNPSAGISTTPLSWVNNLYPMAARY